MIGDSLSSGEFESRDGDGNVLCHDMYEYSWPAVPERLTGTAFHNYSRGGMSAREFYETWADQNDFWQWNQAYRMRVFFSSPCKDVAMSRRTP